jgi:hypothetical protein
MLIILGIFREFCWFSREITLVMLRALRSERAACGASLLLCHAAGFQAELTVLLRQAQHR